MRKTILLISIASTLLSLACGPQLPAKNAYLNAEELMSDFDRQRQAVSSFRMTGRVDHFGGEHRISGKVFLFAHLPDRLRVELVSPFGSALSVLTVNKDHFAMYDLRESRFVRGPAKPCNIARLVRIPLPASDVMRILIGHTPVISGTREVTPLDDGQYLVAIRDGNRQQQITIKARSEALELESSRLDDDVGNVFDIKYSRFERVMGIAIPHEIRVRMPRHKADLLLRYDEGGVEINVDLPEDAWDQTPPAGLKVEDVDCE